MPIRLNISDWQLLDITANNILTYIGIRMHPCDISQYFIHQNVFCTISSYTVQNNTT